jgi:hypothetical protein
MGEKLQHCGIQLKKNSCIIGFNGRKFVKCLETVPTREENLFRCISRWMETSSVVSHNGRKPSLLNPTTQGKMLLNSIPQRQKNKKLK